MLVALIVTIFVFLILGICAGVLFGRKYFPQFDNINDATIFQKNGRHYVLKKGKCTETLKLGKRYEYKRNGEKNIILVPFAYAEEYIRHRRVIGVDANGRLIASPLGGETQLSASESEALIKGLTLGHIGADMLRAMSGKEALSWLMMGIIGLVVGGVVVFGITQFTNKPSATSQATPSVIVVPQGGK